jgi:Bacterial regulatory proteins, tetR family
MKSAVERGERVPGLVAGGIAADAGLTTAGLLHHFPSKDHLLVAVLAERDRLDGVRFRLAGVRGLAALTDLSSCYSTTRWCRPVGHRPVPTWWLVLAGGLASGLTLGIGGVAVADHGPWMVALRSASRSSPVPPEHLKPR